MAASTGQHAFNTLVEWDPTGGSTYAEVINVRTVRKSASGASIDVSHMSSPTGRMEFLPGLQDEGECTLEGLYDPSNAQHDLLFEWPASYPPAVPQWRLTFQEATGDPTYVFKAFLTNKEMSLAHDGAIMLTFTLKATGTITITQ